MKKTGIIHLSISILCLIYFVCLIFLFPTFSNHTVISVTQFVGELATILLLLFPVVSFIYCLIKIFTKKGNFYLPIILGIDLLTLIMILLGFLFFE